MIRRPPRSTLLSLHDALPIYGAMQNGRGRRCGVARRTLQRDAETEPARSNDGRAARYPHADRTERAGSRSEEHTSELQSHSDLVCRLLLETNKRVEPVARDST